MDVKKIPKKNLNVIVKYQFDPIQINPMIKAYIRYKNCKKPCS